MAGLFYYIKSAAWSKIMGAVMNYEMKKGSSLLPYLPIQLL